MKILNYPGFSADTIYVRVLFPKDGKYFLQGELDMNLNGCRECRFYIVDNYRQIICSFNGQIIYRDIYEGRNSRSMILSCPQYRIRRGF